MKASVKAKRDRSRLRRIEANRRVVSTAEACQQAGVSQSTYYNYKKRKKAKTGSWAQEPKDVHVSGIAPHEKHRKASTLPVEIGGIPTVDFYQQDAQDSRKRLQDSHNEVLLLRSLLQRAWKNGH